MLVVAGLGLCGTRDISVGLLREAEDADEIFLETYTSVSPGLRVEDLVSVLGRGVKLVTRKDLEDESARTVLEVAARGKALLLTIGNPLIATTHSSIVVEAAKRGIKVRVLPAPSIIDGIIASTGLHVYKFGRVVSLVFPEDPSLKNYPYTPYSVLKDNVSRGLHTIFLLDIRADEGRYMLFREASELLLRLEERFQENVVDENTLVIGVARATAEDEKVFAGRISEAINADLGNAPHTLIVPGELHDSEIDFLHYKTGRPVEVFKSWNAKVNAKKKQSGTSPTWREP
ncbi:diphthine synthase [Thermofilum pendens]|uniref:Diphthine synthase n=1 Tax=Thermofilum pendens (strain DSM 2475 / Hrk 5) TaxID=368408 RepID=A1RY11_THEPD|nr:diphthine synthase [Thermofilum pendens]ABL78091.1 diphthine synthase [Thermofilum pendens Hrk 5]